jgi:purine nucleoside phosphorylase
MAQELGLPVVAFSMVTNVFRTEDVQQTTSEEVVNAAANAEPNLRRLVTRLLTSDL